MYTLSKLKRLCKTSLISSLPAVCKHTMAEQLADIAVLKRCKQIIPALSPKMHKGQSGRIGVFGGSKDFTGAPYFSGMSALRTGSDLIYIFCVTAAAQPIKSYSPELMVTPFFDVALTSDEIQWMQNLHCAVIGPGLGRFPSTLERLREIMPYLERKSIPLVFDADGICFISESPEIIKSYPEKVYLTPNFNEFKILCKSVLGQCEINLNSVKEFGALLSKELGNHVWLLLKGPVDLIFNSGKLVFENDTLGSSRRCGGQGDILSGCLATFVVWAKQCGNVQEDAYMLAGVAASTLTRVCNRLAFNDHGRGMITSNMIAKIPSTFKLLFEDVQ